jgi:hypothetical protein
MMTKRRATGSLQMMPGRVRVRSLASLFIMYLGILKVL